MHGLAVSAASECNLAADDLVAVNGFAVMDSPVAVDAMGGILVAVLDVEVEIPVVEVDIPVAEVDIPVVEVDIPAAEVDIPVVGVDIPAEEDSF